MFKAIKKFFQKKRAQAEPSPVEESVLVTESSIDAITEDAVKAQKGRTVMVFDTKKRIFVVKKRVARVALYNPSTQSILFKHKNTERVVNVPLEKDALTLPLSGCWFDKETCHIGFYQPGLEYFYLMQDESLKPIRIDAKQFKGVGDYEKMLPLSGFWFDSEIETIGLYDPSSALFLLKHQDENNQQGRVFQYGPFKNHMQPLVGDWSGEGKDSVGLYDAESGVFFLKGTLESSDKQDINFHFGPPKNEMIALSGDWNGTGSDKIGLYSPKDGLFFLMHANQGAEQADVSCYFGPAGKSLIPLVGDWAGEGQDGIAVYDPQTGTAYLKNHCVSGDADRVIQFSEFEPESKPLVVYELI